MDTSARFRCRCSRQKKSGNEGQSYRDWKDVLYLLTELNLKSKILMRLEKWVQD